MPIFANIAKIHNPVLFALDLNSFTRSEIIKPKAAPTTIDKTISVIGFKIIKPTSAPVPFWIVLATPNKIENIIRAAASSKATTGSNVLTKGPSALYCLITSNVAAGAVAQLIALKVKTKGQEITALSAPTIDSSTKWAIVNPIKTKSAAPTASKIVIITTRFPSVLIADNLKLLP